MCEKDENQVDPQADVSWIISSTFIIFTMQSGMYHWYNISFCLSSGPQETMFGRDTVFELSAHL